MRRRSGLSHQFCKAEPALWHLVTAALLLGVAASFYVPALRRTGVWPAPLDDVFIHFDFARSAAEGRPFEWIQGNGYSSGGTSVLYPLVLSVGYLVGFRGEWLGLFAAIVAVFSIFDACRSVRVLVSPCKPWVTFFIPAFVLCVPLVDWSLFSGMEVALFGGILGRALVSVRKVETSPPNRRARFQVQAGLFIALLLAVRPEAIALAVALVVAVGHASGSLRALPSVVRVASPSIFFLGVQALANRFFTGEWAAAGAVRKLLTSDPYATRLDIATEVLKNLMALRTQAFDSALGGSSFSLVVPFFVGVAILDKRSRRVALPLAVGSIGAVFLVAFNSTARYQNWRYAIPSLVMLLVGASLGFASFCKFIERFFHRFSLVLLPSKPFLAAACALALAAVVGPSRTFERQIDHFARASQNIREQQVEVGKKLALLQPKPRRVFLSDAGAIPYFSRLPALDGLGLGGFHDLPFARASVHGVPAVIELLERLPEGDRPDVLAVYPSWWKGLADEFGTRFDSVLIADNVICAAPEKVLYRADFESLSSAFERRVGAVDEVDVADLVSEHSHHYEIPAPHGGWTVGATLRLANGEKRFDAGRIVPQGRQEAFLVGGLVQSGPATLVIRTDGGPPQNIGVVVMRNGREVSSEEIVVKERSQGEWTEVSAPLADVNRGDLVQIRALVGAFRSFHIWLVR